MRTRKSPIHLHFACWSNTSSLLVGLRLDFLELLFSFKMSRKWCTYADCVRGYASDEDAWLRMYQIQNEEDAIEIASALSVQVITSKLRRLYTLPYHLRDFGCFLIQTELPRRWSSARFWFLYYTDRTTSPLNIGEILVPLLYRQNYLAAEHRRDFGSFIIQTELPHRWTSARFWFLIVQTELPRR